MRCLILGASGQVGRQVSIACEDRGLTWNGTYYRRPVAGLHAVDLRDRDAIRDLFNEFEPDVTFLTAAETHMDRAETDPQACLEVNIGGVNNVATEISRLGGKLVFFSTDHVFAECSRAMKESDPLQPLSIYAKSKAAAEASIRITLPQQHLILRTSWVFGPDEAEKNFVYGMVRKLARGEKIKVSNDQFGQPTYTPDLADAVMELAVSDRNGTFHVTGPERHSKFTFGRMIAHIFGYDCDQVIGVPTVDLEQAAPRPKQVWLSTQKLVDAIGPNPIRKIGLGLRELRNQEFGHQQIAWAA